jgi:tight adherence protein C
VTVVEAVIGLAWAACAALAAWCVGRGMTEITYVTLADGRRQERRLPLLYRLLLPFAPNFERWTRRPEVAPMRAEIDARLTAAGFEGLMSAHEFMALRLLMPLAAGPFAWLLMHLLLAHVPGRVGFALRQREPIFGVLLLLWFLLQPNLWLQRALQARHRRIERALPFVLDLLTLSVEAGLDFMTAIKRIIDRRAVDPLGEELIRMFREVQLGKTRREALRDMGRRARQADLRTVVNALVQADELGVSIASILRIQADQMRIRRFNNAEKRANEAPVRMLLPLIGFIFPAVFIVLLGPIVLQIARHGF